MDKQKQVKTMARKELVPPPYDELPSDLAGKAREITESIKEDYISPNSQRPYYFKDSDLDELWTERSGFGMWKNHQEPIDTIEYASWNPRSNQLFVEFLTLLVENGVKLQTLRIESPTFPDPTFLSLIFKFSALISLELLFEGEIIFPDNPPKIPPLLKLTIACSNSRIPPWVLRPTLEYFTLCRTPNLGTLPDNFVALQNLLGFRVLSAPALRRLPESVGSCAALKEVVIKRTGALVRLPDGIGRLTGLIFISCYHVGLVTLPDSIGGCAALEIFQFEQCPRLTHLPPAICRLTSLKEIRMSDCRRFVALPDCLPNKLAISLTNAFRRDLTRHPHDAFPNPDMIRNPYNAADPMWSFRFPLSIKISEKRHRFMSPIWFGGLPETFTVASAEDFFKENSELDRKRFYIRFCPLLMENLSALSPLIRHWIAINSYLDDSKTDLPIQI